VYNEEKLALPLPLRPSSFWRYVTFNLAGDAGKLQSPHLSPSAAPFVVQRGNFLPPHKRGMKKRSGRKGERERE